MNSRKDTRPYNMKNRAKAAAHTERRIMEAVIGLWQVLPIHEITLEAIAERAGVTVRTVLRKYGSKEGLFEACLKQDSSKIEINRGQVQAGDVPGALRILLDDYEAYGDANIRTLAVEEELEMARKILEKGRQYHRQWCARVFAPWLPEPSTGDYEKRLLAFIAATDVYLWKLLRRDLGRSPGETLETIQTLVNGLIKDC
ncbi:MAG: TetR/AcrR family transcriptional regulator [Phaeodactylibacter sp.]|nr:TetR/AcrR family transcriptional regulator [Phaeodactylibacter sp.]MCB9048058.1 TetR/AcrR family transcriptional regulator [Lewinellaceae bacterium]